MFLARLVFIRLYASSELQDFVVLRLEDAVDLGESVVVRGGSLPEVVCDPLPNTPSVGCLRVCALQSCSVLSTTLSFDSKP